MINDPDGRILTMDITVGHTKMQLTNFYGELERNKKNTQFSQLAQLTFRARQKIIAGDFNSVESHEHDRITSSRHRDPAVTRWLK